MGLAGYITFRIFFEPDYTDRIVKDPGGFIIFVGLFMVIPWAIGWGIRCGLTRCRGIGLFRKGGWKHDPGYRHRFQYMIDLHRQFLKFQKKTNPGNKHTAYLVGLAKRTNFYFVGSFIIGTVLALEDFVMWQDNVLLLVIVVLLWTLGIAILYGIIIDGTFLHLVLGNSTDNRRIGQIGMAGFVVGVLVFFYFRAGYIFTSS